MRHKMAHSPDRPKLQPKLDVLRNKYFEECPEESRELPEASGS